MLIPSKQNVLLFILNAINFGVYFDPIHSLRNFRITIVFGIWLKSKLLIYSFVIITHL